MGTPLVGTGAPLRATAPVQFRDERGMGAYPGRSCSNILFHSGDDREFGRVPPPYLRDETLRLQYAGLNAIRTGDFALRHAAVLPAAAPSIAVR